MIYARITKIIMGFVFPRRENNVDFNKYTSADMWKSLPRAKDVRGLARTYAVLSYKHKITRAMIWQIKYKKDCAAIRHGGYILYKFFEENMSGDCPEPILIPIPISPARRRERGYNQCELIAKEMKKYMPLTCQIRTDILVRKIHKSRQTLQSRADRIQNMHGVFSVCREFYSDKDDGADEIFKNRVIILLDDVITTGSTIDEAHKTLEKAGFKNIFCLALAH